MGHSLQEGFFLDLECQWFSEGIQDNQGIEVWICSKMSDTPSVRHPTCQYQNWAPRSLHRALRKHRTQFATKKTETCNQVYWNQNTKMTKSHKRNWKCCKFWYLTVNMTGNAARYQYDKTLTAGKDHILRLLRTGVYSHLQNTNTPSKSCLTGAQSQLTKDSHESKLNLQYQSNQTRSCSDCFEKKKKLLSQGAESQQRFPLNTLLRIKV